MKKIVFFTFHNWEAKRQGGFHKFAEYASLANYEVQFISYPRPLYSIFRNTETFNFKRIFKQLKGITYYINNNILYNRTLLSLALPVPTKFRYLLPTTLLLFFEGKTIPPIRWFFKRHLSKTDYFIFESTSSILLAERIKKLSPQSKIIYRPSDPLIGFKHGEIFKKKEIDLVLMADMVFFVNNQGLLLYKQYIDDINLKANYMILSNGVDIEKFKNIYPCPDILKKNNTALYIGAAPIDWSMIIEASIRTPQINYIIITPVKAPSFFLNKINNIDNLFFINGVDRNEVPQWVTNADLIIVPYPKDVFNKAPTGITAKYYQAIAAEKPIVAYFDTEDLRELNIPVVYNVDDFIFEVLNRIKLRRVKYPINLNNLDWDYVCKAFYEKIESL